MKFGQQKSTQDLRRFGLAFGTAMTILGSLLLWRDKAPAPWILGLAAFAIVSGLIAPRILWPLEMVLAGWITWKIELWA